MQNPSTTSHNVNSFNMLPRQSIRRLSGRCFQVSSGQHSSPTVFPEKRSKVKSSKQNGVNATKNDPRKVELDEIKIDVGDEQCDLLGYEVFSGKLLLDRKSTSDGENVQTLNKTKIQEGVVAKLTSKALTWGSNVLYLNDVISVSYNFGFRHFTVHSYPTRKRSAFSCSLKPQRSRKDFRFLASSPEEALQWVRGFADQQCFIKLSPHPLDSSKKHFSDIVSTDMSLEYNIKSKSPPKVLVILNPRSGRGRSSKVFHNKVEPIFKLAGFKMEVVKTSSAGHAKRLASSVDFSTCPDGIICVGGDGIINEVLNGLLNRNDQKQAISIPIGIIPAGSDNSLVWTVLGVKDPVSAAIAIVKGGLTAVDVFAVEWIQTGFVHYGTTVSYFGFVSDVLELSDKYQKRFGPLRYLVAGFLKFLCLPKYSFDVEYLSASVEASNPEGKVSEDHERMAISDIYPDIMKKSRVDGITRASSFSSIESIMSPSRMSGDLDATCAANAGSEPSEYVRCLDPKSKRLSLGRSHILAEPEVIHYPQSPLSSNSNRPRARSKPKADGGWTVSTTTHDSRFSLGNMTMNEKEDVASTLSDPGPIWDAEPRWDTEPNWENENPIQLPGPSDDPIEIPGPTYDIEMGVQQEVVPRFEEKWVAKKGKFLGILVCNHSCRTVQSLSSQVVAPKANHDDNTLDLLLVHGSGRLRLLRFFIYLQFGWHLSLPYVEYIKVKSVKVKPGKTTHKGCGIDGELLEVNGQVICSLLLEQCRLIGYPARTHVQS